MPKASFKVSVSKNVVRCSLNGKWNVYTARRFDIEMRTVVQSIKTQPWGHLVLLDEWVLGTPEFEPVIFELVSWCFRNNVKATALVFPENALKAFQLGKVGLRKFEDDRVMHFSDEKRAIDWLASKGFEENANE